MAYIQEVFKLHITKTLFMFCKYSKRYIDKAMLHRWAFPAGLIDTYIEITTIFLWFTTTPITDINNCHAYNASIIYKLYCCIK